MQSWPGGVHSLSLIHILVGALAADLSLYASDYRCGEQTFELLTQAAGRAGRGNLPGNVIIQTYQPDHYCIVTAASQDYEAFYGQEMAYRRLLDVYKRQVQQHEAVPGSETLKGTGRPK